MLRGQPIIHRHDGGRQPARQSVGEPVVAVQIAQVPATSVQVEHGRPAAFGRRRIGVIQAQPQVAQGKILQSQALWDCRGEMTTGPYKGRASGLQAVIDWRETLAGLDKILQGWAERIGCGRLGHWTSGRVE
ncbi:hypothetical protein D3C84_849540 [compost metagenome]